MKRKYNKTGIWKGRKNGKRTPEQRKKDSEWMRNWRKNNKEKSRQQYLKDYTAKKLKRKLLKMK